MMNSVATLQLHVVAAVLLVGTAFGFQQVNVVLPSSSAARPLPQPLFSNRVNIDEATERDIGTMDEWATACQVQKAAGFQLTTQDGKDWSIMTTQDLPQGTPVLYVPSGMILSSQRIKQEIPAGEISGGLDYLGRLGHFSQVSQFYLFLKVLLEYERGDQSPYFPWINSLPRLFYNAVSMTDFCHECLPPLVFSLARTERVKFDNFYYALQKVGGILSQETKEDKELAKWAFNVVYTRSWGPDDNKQIIPVADMFNHGTDTEVQITNDGEGNCIVYTTKDVAAGSPLRVSYADPTNPSHLFATYGFLDQTSPATFCKLMIQPTEELKNLGYDHSRMLFYKDTGSIAPEVWDVMLYHTVLAGNQNDRQAFYQAHMSGDVDTKQAIHQFYAPQTVAALQKHVDTFLQNLDTLSAKTNGKSVEEHPRLPLILHHNEFVKTTFLAVKSGLDAMAAQTVGV